MMSLDPTIVPKRLDRPLFVRRLFDRSNISLVFDQSTGKIYIMDGVSRLVWNSCNGRRTVDDIVSAVRSESSNDPDPNLAIDVDQIESVLSELSERGWLALVSRPLAVRTGV